MTLSRLIYVSRANVSSNDHEALRAMAGKDASLHSRDRITGLLLLANDCFVQIVEGSREALSRLLGQLHKDGLHGEINIVEMRPISQRQFSDWSLGWAVDASNGSEGFELLKDKLAGDLLKTLLTPIGNPMSGAFDLSASEIYL